MSSFYDALLTFDVNDVTLTDQFDSIKDFLQNGKSYSFFKKKVEDIIPRESDVLVGFYSETEITFTLNVGNQDIITHSLKAGEFTFALDGTFIPLLRILPESEFRVSSPVVVIYAVLDNPLRHTLIVDNFESDNYYYNGVIQKKVT